MTEVGVIWGALTYSPGSRITGRVAVRDAQGRSAQSIHWQAEYNSVVILSGGTPDIAIPAAQPGVYRVTVTVIDSTGVTAQGESTVYVERADQQVKASLQPPVEDGTYVLMARMFTPPVAYGPSTLTEAPGVVCSASHDVFLVPGTTHVTFDLDPDGGGGEDDIVVRTRFGNWALRGGAGLTGAEKIGYDYRVDNPFIPAPADLRLCATMEAIKLAAGAVGRGSFRVRVNCWRLVPRLYQYEQCPFSIYPGGAGLRQRRFAVLFTEVEVETDYLSPDNNRLGATSSTTTYTAPNVTSIPAMALTAPGTPYPVNQGTGISYTEANRYVIYESDGVSDLDAKAVAGLENVRPFALWLNQPGTPPVMQRIKRLGGEMALYVNNGPILAGTIITVRVETGTGVVTKLIQAQETVYSADPALFFRVGSVAFNMTDFQFSQTGVVARFSVNEIPVVESTGTVAWDSVPVWGPDLVVSTAALYNAVHFDGACYTNPVPLVFTETEEIAVVVPVAGCHASVCGPQGLYCYDDGVTEVPSVTVSATDPSASEPASTGTFTFVRTGSTDATLTVDFTVTGTASSGVDYASIGTSVTFGVGQSTATKTVTPIDDVDVEDDETVIVTLDAGTGYIVGSPSVAVVTLASNDLPVVTVQATDSAASEIGPDTGEFTFYRTGPTTASLTIAFTAGGTAVSGSDYTAMALSVTFGVGQASVTRTVTPINDVEVEPVETVTATVSPGVGYVVGSPATATIDLVSDDAIPTVTVQATDSAAAEAGPDTGTFTFYRTGSTVGTLTAYFAVTGTATTVTDFASIGTSVTFGVGQATATKTVTPVDDADVESPETVIVTLTSDPGYVIGVPGSATVTITSDDVTPSAALTVSLEGGDAVDGYATDETIVNSTPYFLTTFRVPANELVLIDGSSGDNDPFVSVDVDYDNMLKDAYSRASGRPVTDIYANDGMDLLSPGSQDPGMAGFDGFTSPTWQYYGTGGYGWPHTSWPNGGVYPPGGVYFSSGWCAIVYAFTKSENPTVVPGRWDIDTISASGAQTVPGTIGVPYTGHFRVRGVISRSVYTGGSNDGAYFQTGGAIGDARQDYAKLTVSDPAATYYLNRGATKTGYNVPLDYTVDIPVVGGATVTLEISNQDGFQYSAGSDGLPVPLTGFSDSENIWIRLDITV